MKKITSIICLLLSLAVKAQFIGGFGDGHALDSTIAVVIVPAFTVNTHTICVGQSVTFTDQSTPSGYTLNTISQWNWSFPGGATPTSTLQNPAVTYTASGLFPVSLTVALNGGCKTNTISQNAFIFVSAGPVCVISSSNILCNGNTNGSAIATGTGITSYTWSNGQNTQVATNLSAGVHSVVVSDMYSCKKTSTVQITQPSLLNGGIHSNTTTVCAGSSISLVAFANGGTAPYTYSWTPGPNTNTYSISEPIAGNYNYGVSCIDNNGCVMNRVISLTFNAIPTIAVNNLTICAGQKITLTATGAENYYWNPLNVFGETFTATAENNLFLNVVGSLNGCSSSALATVLVNQLPKANVIASTNKGCVPLCTSFSCQSTNSIQDIKWLLNTNQTTIATGSIINNCFNDAGTFLLTASFIDENGCTNNSQPFQVQTYPTPIADFHYGPGRTVVNEEVEFIDESRNAVITEWSWHFTNQKNNTSLVQNPKAIYENVGAYPVALIVRTDKGCSDTVVKSIVIGEDFGIYIPNCITPNGDGLNDTFQPKAFGITKYQLNVYNRWGQNIFSTNNFEQGWNGKDKGEEVQDGTYVWKISLTNVHGKAKDLSGIVTVLK